MDLLELLWQHNTPSGRLVILAIIALGVVGSGCALSHLQRYRDAESQWLENVRDRIRRSRDMQGTAEPTPPPSDEPPGEIAPIPAIPFVPHVIDLRELAEGIPSETLIGDRLATINRLKQVRVTVNLDALQQGTRLKESSRWTLSFPAYVISLVMMLGLLGTFIGLSLMVSEIQRALPDPSSHADAAQWADSVSSLGKILAGKKTAFSATLAGIFFSIIVSLFNFSLARAQSEFYDRLERFTTEELLPAAFMATDDETPWEKLSRQLGDSFDRLQSLVTTQARSAEQIAAIESAFGLIVSNLEVMTQRAATAPLQGVTGEMTNAIGQLAQINGSILAVAERLPQIVTTFRQSQQATLQEIQNAMQAQQGAVERLTQALRANQSLSSRWSFGFAAGGAALVVLVLLLIQRIG